MRFRPFAVASLVQALVLVAAPAVKAQQDPALILANAQRSMVTRKELQASLDTLDKLIGSTGYSAALRSSKQREADLIRERLVEGDLQVGDIISINIVGDQTLSAPYPVTNNRSIVIPGGGEISVRHILRSEVQDSLTEEFKKYVRDPVVRANAQIRIAVFGAVNKPGYVQASASALLSEVLMTNAGGPASNMQPEKSTIMRGERIVVDGPQFDEAIRKGMTLDQLNVEAGDQIQVAAKPSSGWFWRVVEGTSALAGVLYLALRIF